MRTSALHRTTARRATRPTIRRRRHRCTGGRIGISTRGSATPVTSAPPGLRLTLLTRSRSMDSTPSALADSATPVTPRCSPARRALASLATSAISNAAPFRVTRHFRPAAGIATSHRASPPPPARTPSRCSRFRAACITSRARTATTRAAAEIARPTRIAWAVTSACTAAHSSIPFTNSSASSATRQDLRRRTSACCAIRAGPVERHQ